MKHFKLFLTVLFLAVFGLGNAWGDSFSTTYNYAGVSADPATWSLTNCTDKDTYWLVPSGSDPSVATLPGVFDGKTITSDVVVTLNVACYGSGTNPSASTFALYKETACTNAITATKGGNLPTSSTYTDVTYTISFTNAASLTGDLAIKITKPGKQIRLKSIKVEFTYTESGSTVSVTGVTLDQTSKTLTVGETFDLIATVAPADATTKTVTWSSDNEDVATVSNGTVTAAAEGTANITVKTTDGDKTATCAVTVNAAPKHNVIWSVNGATTSEEVAEGADITFTTPTSIPDDVAFMGWSASPITGTQATAPTYVTSATMGTADVTYYAVFATASAGTSTWNQVTTLAGITEGTYVIKNDSYVLPNAATSSAPAATTAPTVEDGVISSDVTDAMKWTLTSTGTNNQFYVKNGTDYLYEISNNNGIRVGTTSDKWTFAVNTTGYFSMKGANNSRYCAKYTGGSDWRSYTSATATNYANSGKLELYKLTSSVTYSAYCTSVVVKTVSSIALSGTYPTEFWIGDTFKHDGLVVTATYTDASTEDVTANATFSTPDMATAGEKTITVTYKGKETSYNIEVKTIANTAETAYTTAEAKAKYDAGKDLTSEVYVKGKVSKLFSTSVSTKGQISFYINATGTAADDDFECYQCLNISGAKFTSLDDVKVGADVVVKGKLTKYGTTYELAANCELVSYTAPAVTKSNPSLTLSYKSALYVDDAGDEYTVTYTGDGELSVTSSADAVAEVIIVDNTILVSPKAAGTTKITVSASETDNYYAASKEYTLTVSAALTAAELPFEFDGGKADVESNASMRQKGLNTTDYSASPKLKFDGAGDEVIIRIADAAKKVTYTIKGNSYTAGQFDVLQSADNKTYTTLKSHTTLSDQATEISTDKPAATTRYIKFVYTTQNKGNVALGAINIIAASAKEDPTFSIADLTVNNGDDITPVITTNNTDAYTVSYSSDNEEVALASGDEIVTMGVGTATITATMAATDNFNQAQTTFVITVDAAGTTTATWVASDWATAESITTGTNLDDNKVIAADANVDMTWSKGTGTNTPYYAPGDPGMRLYTSNTITFASKNGKIISYIKFDLGASNTGNAVSADKGTYADGVWTGFANEVTISNGTGSDKMYFNNITIKYVDGTVTTLSITDMSMKPTDAATTIAVTSNKENPTVVYSSYDEAVITIANGQVTPVAVGETNVTATIAQEGSYTAATTTFKVTVAAKEVTTLSFPAANYSVKSNETFTAPVLTVNPAELTGITYSSTNTEVATVDAATGAVTLVAVGATTIKATYAGNETYEASEASYVLTVLDPNTDVITRASIGNEETSYVDWSDKTFASGTKYAGLSAAPNSSEAQKAAFSLRGAKSSTYSGIVSTSTMGKVKKVTIKWSSAQTTARTLNIYGSNTAFTSVEDVTTLEPVATAASGSTPNEIDFSTLGDYAYIGIYPSSNNACYIDEIDITWTPVEYLQVAVAATTNGTVTVDKTSCLEGAEVTITTTPAEHYELATLKVYKTGDEATEVTVDADGKFTMPAYNVTVAATFSAIEVVVPDGEQVAWVEKSGDKYYALATSTSGSYMAAQEVTVINGKVVVADDDAKNAIMWVVTNTEGSTYTFKNVWGKYLAGSSSTNLGLNDAAYNWTKASDGHYYNGSRTPKYNGSSDFRHYSASSNNAVLMPIAVGLYTRDMTSGNMGTHCYPFTIQAGDYVGATFYTPAYHIGDTKIYWDEVTGDIEAGKPYLIVPDEAGVTFMAIKQAETAAEAGTLNGMVGSYTQHLITANDGNYIVYQNQFRLAGENVAVGANRAYIHLESVSKQVVDPAPGRRRIVMNNAAVGTVTGLDEQQVATETRKVLINGQLFILRGEKMYNAAGILVK